MSWFRGKEPLLWEMWQIIRKEGHAEGAPQGSRWQPGLSVCRVWERFASHPSCFFTKLKLDLLSYTQIIIIYRFCLPLQAWKPSMLWGTTWSFTKASKSTSVKNATASLPKKSTCWSTSRDTQVVWDVSVNFSMKLKWSYYCWFTSIPTWLQVLRTLCVNCVGKRSARGQPWRRTS